LAKAGTETHIPSKAIVAIVFFMMDSLVKVDEIMMFLEDFLLIR